MANAPGTSSSDPSSLPQQNNDGGGKVTEHDFCLLDQSNRRNIFFAEILRGITKTSLNKGTGPKIGKKLLALAVKEIGMLVEACAAKSLAVKSEASDPTQMESTELQDLTKIKGHIDLVKRTLQKHHRQGKNVVRVILGVDPISPKNASDGLFPVVPKYGSLPATSTKKQQSKPSKKEVKSDQTAKVAKKKKAKLGSLECAMGDVAINRAIARGIEMDKSKGLQTEGAAESNSLALSAIEVCFSLKFLLAVMIPRRHKIYQYVSSTLNFFSFALFLFSSSFADRH